MFYDDGLRVTKKLPVFPRHDKIQEARVAPSIMQTLGPLSQ